MIVCVIWAATRTHISFPSTVWLKLLQPGIAKNTGLFYANSQSKATDSPSEQQSPGQCCRSSISSKHSQQTEVPFLQPTPLVISLQWRFHKRKGKLKRPETTICTWHHIWRAVVSSSGKQAPIPELCSTAVMQRLWWEREVILHTEKNWHS